MVTTTPNIKKIVAYTSFATFFEWFDRIIFTLCTVLVFNKVFFPQLGATAGVTASLLVMYVSYLLKPLGAIAFGHFGDRYGRRSTLFATLILTSASTLAMGLLPGYASIGILAPILLTLFRTFQTIGMATEWSASSLLVYENTSRKDRAWYSGILQATNPLSILVAGLLFAGLNTYLTKEQFLDFGWRIPFLLSLILGFFSFKARIALGETQEFLKIKEEKQIVKVPFLQLIKNNPKQILIATGLKSVTIAFGLMVPLFILTYLVNTKGLPRANVSLYHSIGAIAQLVAIPFFAWLTFKYGCRKIYMIGSVMAFVFAYPIFYMIDTGYYITGLIAGHLLLHTLISTTHSASMPSVFDTNVRYTGTAISFQLAATLGGFMPILATQLAPTYGLMIGAYIVMILAPTTFWAATYLKDERV
jgi:MFS family permease